MARTNQKKRPDRPCTGCGRTPQQGAIFYTNKTNGHRRSICNECKNSKRRVQHKSTLGYRPFPARVEKEMDLAPPEALKAGIRAFCGIDGSFNGKGSRCLVTPVNR